MGTTMVVCTVGRTCDLRGGGLRQKVAVGGGGIVGWSKWVGDSLSPVKSRQHAASEIHG
jgi:hypothetical protein